MEPRITQKPTKIGNQQYILKKMDPRLACWLFSVLATKAPSGSPLLSALGNCSKAEFDEIQGHALRFAYSLQKDEENEFEIPLIGSDGTISVKELASNPAFLFKLTSESIMFNISSFLEGEE